MIDRIQSHANRIALEAAIRDRWLYRLWYRTVARQIGLEWSDLEASNTAQLRRLIRLLRRERSR